MITYRTFILTLCTLHLKLYPFPNLFQFLFFLCIYGFSQVLIQIGFAFRATFDFSFFFLQSAKEFGLVLPQLVHTPLSSVIVQLILLQHQMWHPGTIYWQKKIELNKHILSSLYLWAPHLQVQPMANQKYWNKLFLQGTCTEFFFPSCHFAKQHSRVTIYT